MPDQPDQPDQQAQPGEPGDDLEKLLRKLLGTPMSEGVLGAIRNSGLDIQALARDPEAYLAAMPPHMRNLIGQQVQAFMSAAKGPVNWKFAENVAFSAISKDPALTTAQADDIRAALAAADLWLDPVVGLNASRLTRQAWTRREWVLATAPGWTALCENVARQSTRAISNALAEQLRRVGIDIDDVSGTMPGLVKQIGPLKMTDIINQLSATIFGMQLGHAIGPLASEAFGSTDIGFPLGKGRMSALVGQNVQAFATDVGVPLEQTLGFLATREVAHQRLFGAAPWLRNHILAALRRFSVEIRVNTDMLEDTMRKMMSTGELNLREVFSADANLFNTGFSPAQRQALEQLETTLAVVEGWVADVTQRACLPYIPNALALGEMMRRRRAAGSPAEQMLQELVGLRLRPKRALAAQQLWESIGARLGIAERDRMWDHAGLLPSAQDLDDPDGFFDRRAQSQAAQSDMDAELRSMLGGELGWARGLDPHMDSAGDDTVTRAEAADRHQPETRDGDGDEDADSPAEKAGPDAQHPGPDRDAHPDDGQGGTNPRA